MALDSNDLDKLRKIAALADNKGATIDERKAALGKIVGILQDRNVPAGSIVSSLEHFEAKGDVEQALTELSDAVETLSTKLQEREKQLVDKTAALAKAEDELVKLRARPTSGQSGVNSAFNAAASGASINNAHIANAAYEARIKKLEDDLKAAAALQKQSDDATQKLLADITTLRTSNAKLLQEMDNKAAKDAALLRAAMEKAMESIMQPSSNAASAVNAPQTGVLPEIVKYFRNASSNSQAITKLREDVTFLITLCAKALNSTVDTRRTNTTVFMGRAPNDPEATAELNIYQIKNGPTMMLLINNDKVYLYYQPAYTPIHVDDLKQYVYWDNGKVANSPQYENKLNFLGYKGREPLKHVYAKQSFSAPEITRQILQILIKDTSQINIIKDTLRPMGYVF